MLTTPLIDPTVPVPSLIISVLLPLISHGADPCTSNPVTPAPALIKSVLFAPPVLNVGDELLMCSSAIVSVLPGVKPATFVTVGAGVLDPNTRMSLEAGVVRIGVQLSGLVQSVLDPFQV